MTSLQGGDANSSLVIRRLLIWRITVFKDVSAPRDPLAAFGPNTDHAHQQHFEHSQTQQLVEGATRAEHSGFIFDGSNFNTEDLGQFWLWNMDPYVDDSVASWQSGDDFTQ